MRTSSYPQNPALQERLFSGTLSGLLLGKGALTENTAKRTHAQVTRKLNSRLRFITRKLNSRFRFISHLPISFVAFSRKEFVTSGLDNYIEISGCQPRRN